ncbi:hypothetical protein [Borrelia parkeri]|uniref:hypothetical protein n=1 Tax=Borrelia parkeri TaxID=141 RepID=UPI0003DEE51F|nr:hypothetical protein [Borrelia parkeri]AHF45627.1 hypothetical protein X966_p0390 [Borrelia parkeri HR1]
MFIRFYLIMCRIFLFYVLGVFLISASDKVESYCERDYFCYKRYSESFKSGSISRISFWEEDITESVKERVRTTTDKEYKKVMEEGYPAYFLEFNIVGEHRAINVKQVLFDGIKAEASIFHLYEPSWQLSTIKDFQMGPADANFEFTKLIFPIPVNNTFTISLRRGLVDKLKAQTRIKITLISTYDKKFVVETDNFIKKYGF